MSLLLLAEDGNLGGAEVLGEGVAQGCCRGKGGVQGAAKTRNTLIKLPK